MIHVYLTPKISLRCMNSLTYKVPKNGKEKIDAVFNVRWALENNAQTRQLRTLWGKKKGHKKASLKDTYLFNLWFS